MIDPDAMLQVMVNENTNVEIDVVPDSYYEIWDLDDDKDRKKYFKTIERIVRNSFEYKEFIQYIKQNFGMDKCAFINSAKGTEYKVEQHHYPFTLYDIVEIVYNKRVFYGELLDVEMVAKEVTMLHYKMIIGLIPLSKTVHELVHNEWIFIPVDKVLGNWQHFMAVYKDYMEVDTADVIERIIEFSENYDKERNEEILSQNNIYLNYKDEQYKLPDLKQVYSTMRNRIETIKNNYYELPEVTEEEYLKKKAEMNKKEKVDPFIWLD
jgi:hypothetical protein